MRSARDNGATEKTRGLLREVRLAKQADEESQHAVSTQSANSDCGTNDPALFLADQTEERGGVGGDGWQPPPTHSSAIGSRHCFSKLPTCFPMNPLCPLRLLSPHQSKVFLFSFTERDQQTDMLEVFNSFSLFFPSFFDSGRHLLS